MSDKILIELYSNHIDQVLENLIDESSQKSLLEIKLSRYLTKARKMIACRSYDLSKSIIKKIKIKDTALKLELIKVINDYLYYEIKLDQAIDYIIYCVGRSIEEN